MVVSDPCISIMFKYCTTTLTALFVCLCQLVRSKASTQGKHLQTHSSTVVLSLQVSTENNAQ